MWRGADRGRSQMILTEYRYDPKSKDSKSIYLVRHNSRIHLKWFTEFGHLNRGDMLTSEQHRCHNEKKKFQRRV